jgi:uncharacterized protein (UPF0333 family)
MAEEYSDKFPGQNESNYGFPFVEVTPLENTNKKKASVNKEPIIENDPPKAEKEPISIKESIKPAPMVKKKRSQLPLQFSLVMLILIILSVMAYFLYFIPAGEGDQVALEMVPQKIEPEKLVVEEREPEVLIEPRTEDPESIQESESKKEENLGMKLEVPELVPAPVKSISGGINKVTQKASVPQYFIIVSSTASEKVALEQAQELINNNNNEVWVIYPYGETTNYRLAIGKYSALAEATEALEKRKADFDASIWILKY